MLREQSKIIGNFQRALDIFLTASAFVCAYFIKLRLLPIPYRGLVTVPNYYIVLLLIVIVWHIVLNTQNLYRSYRTLPLKKIYLDTFRAVSTSMMLLAMTMYFLKITDVSRIMIGIFYILNLTFLCFSKTLVYYLLKRIRKGGYNFRNIIIMGSRDAAKDMIASVGDRIGAGYRIIGCLDQDKTNIGKKVLNGVTVIDTFPAIERILKKDTVDELIFATPLKTVPGVQGYIDLAEQMGVTVRVLPQWYIRQLGIEPKIGTLRLEEFLGIPTMAINCTLGSKGEILFKNVFEYGLAALFSIVAAPFCLLIVAAIKCISPGPVFFRQERVGQNGRRFILYKFRTMVPGAEQERQALETFNEADGPVFKISKDPRVIPYIGTFLRRTGLDELPQLINVLKGELSIVGPRPPIPSEVDQYDVWQRRRLSMKPGITCLWQVTPNRNRVCFTDWMKMDLRYIDNWSLKLDFKILAMTALTVIRGSGR
jgi:exopolysaccharide biosynthesis polyprenyl glycosylphosphotransferase